MLALPIDPDHRPNGSNESLFGQITAFPSYVPGRRGIGTSLLRNREKNFHLSRNQRRLGLEKDTGIVDLEDRHVSEINRGRYEPSVEFMKYRENRGNVSCESDSRLLGKQEHCFPNVEKDTLFHRVLSGRP